MDVDASETDRFGQDVDKTYPQADVFIDESRNPERPINLLFGDTAEAPSTGDYAMYLAQATAARSPTASRRVGAVSVDTRGSVLALGVNEVPEIAGERPDTILGYDTSENEKRDLVRNTLHRLGEKGWLTEEKLELMQGEKQEWLDEAVADLVDVPGSGGL